LGTDSFTYTIQDTQGATSTATISLTITGNALPEAGADEVSTWVNTAVTFDPLANDSDPNLDSLTIVSTTLPLHGAVSILDSQLVYTPTASYVGQDNFTYTIADGRGGTATGEVTVTVNAYYQFLPFIEREE